MSFSTRWRSAIVMLIVLMAVPPQTEAAKFNRVVDIGQVAPEWKDLPGTDGKTHSFAEHQKSRLVVIMFIRNNCPIAQAYEARIRDFVEKYGPQEVTVVGINVSADDGESLKEMQARASDRKYTFPYLRDESQQIGKAYGATNTPHVFVLDQKRRIAYMGAIDDNNKPDQVEEHYLVNAVESLLAGQPVDVTETLQRGCHIDYKAAAAKAKNP